MINLNDAPLQGEYDRPIHYDLDKLSNDLRSHAPAWVPELFPAGRISARGDELRLANITGVPPRKEGSCVIDLVGEKAGCWYDHSTGQGGDPLSTLTAATGLRGVDLFKRAEEIVGQQRRNTSRATLPPPTPQKRDHGDEIAFVLQQSKRPITGTLAETYLIARGLYDPGCGDLLYHDCLTDWAAKRGRPAMIALVRDPETGAWTGGIHRTYLADDGSRKATVEMEKTKMMLGPCAGVVMLMPMGEDGALGVAEGIETSLAAAAIAGIPVWAALSAGNLAKFAFPAGLSDLTIFADRGEGGENAAWTLYRRAVEAGIPVFVVLPKSDDDFNKDLLLGHTAMEYRPEKSPDIRPPAMQNEQESGRGLPIVRVGGGALSFAIDGAETILIADDKGIFQRGDFVVRPAPVMVTIADNRKTSAIRLLPVRTQHMIERFTRWVDFQKYNVKAKKWVSIDCPANVAAAYLERVGEWNLPVLTGLASAPMLRPDGSILDQPGYDPVTGILYDPRGVSYPSIPREPTIGDARAALAEIKTLLAEFPFVPDDRNSVDPASPSASRSVALSGLLTAADRRSIPHAPLHAFSAPAMGSGKSKLVDLAPMIVSGHEAPVLAQGKTEEEMEKRLGAALIAGDPLVSFDNCEQPLGGELLCQALTQASLSIRILGKSLNVMVPVNAAFFATGNNLVITGDMTRRTLVGALDAKCERPELRQFKMEDPVAVIRRARPRYVAAILTILRAYHVAGRPPQSSIPLGSFEVWSRRVRDALIWLGEPDPCTTMERARADDPRTQELAAVLTRWDTSIGNTPVTVKEVIDKATDRYQPADVPDMNRAQFLCPEFREALLAVAGDGGIISSRRLGTWLGRNKAKVVNQLRLEMTTPQRGDNRWQVVSVG